MVVRSVVALAAIVILGTGITPSAGFLCAVSRTPSFCTRCLPHPEHTRLSRSMDAQTGLCMSAAGKKGNGPCLTNVQRAITTRERVQTEKNPNKVMVSNLDYALSEKDLERFCSQAGNVVCAKLIRKRYARTSKGYGFVEFDIPLAATIAIEDLNGMELNGRKVEIKPSISQLDVTKAEALKAQRDARRLEKERRREMAGEGADEEDVTPRTQQGKKPLCTVDEWMNTYRSGRFGRKK